MCSCVGRHFKTHEQMCACLERCDGSKNRSSKWKGSVSGSLFLLVCCVVSFLLHSQRLYFVSMRNSRSVNLVRGIKSKMNKHTTGIPDQIETNFIDVNIELNGLLKYRNSIYNSFRFFCNLIIMKNKY